MQIERSFSVPFLFIVLAICLFASLSYAQTEIVLYNFLGGPKDGASPSGLVLDSAGNLYGTTRDGGTSAGGIAFEISPSGGGSWTETILHNFTGGADGFNPSGGLILDAAGNLYGTTLAGGTHNKGVVYEITP